MDTIIGVARGGHGRAFALPINQIIFPPTAPAKRPISLAVLLNVVPFILVTCHITAKIA